MVSLQYCCHVKISPLTFLRERDQYFSCIDYLEIESYINKITVIFIVILNTAASQIWQNDVGPILFKYKIFLILTYLALPINFYTKSLTD